MATFHTYPGFMSLQVENAHHVRIQEGNNEPDLLACTCEHCSRHAEEMAQNDHNAWYILNPFVDEEERTLNLWKPRRKQRTSISFTDGCTDNIPSAEEIFAALVSGGKTKNGLVDNTLDIPAVHFMAVVRLLRKHLKTEESAKEERIQRGRPSQRTPSSPFRRSNSFP